MECFSQIKKQNSLPSSSSDHQQHIPQHESNILSSVKINQISTYQEKVSFLKYASSLIEIGRQDQQKNQNIYVYEESELLNPPQSLIEEYETMKKERMSFVNISCETFKYKNQSIRNIEKGLNKIAVFLQSRYEKNVLLNNSKPISSLIDIVSLISIKKIVLTDQKIHLEKAFFKIKSIYQNLIGKNKKIKPSIPIDRKNKLKKVSKQTFFPLKQIAITKNKATEQLVGNLTFKMLVLENQCFEILKANLLNCKIKKIIFLIKKLLLRNIFLSIKTFDTKKLLRLDSKILSSSKSKLKLSSSKLKIQQINSKTKLILKKNKQLNGNFLIEQAKSKERVETSQIIQNFDLNELQQKKNSDESEKTGKKKSFISLSKKKIIKQSNSQVETLNSKRSSQSEYQFTQGIISKVSSCKMSPSAKNYTQEYQSQDEDEQQILTQKIIKKQKPSRNIVYEKPLNGQQIGPAKEIKIIQKLQRKYLLVRTNLFQLPMQMVLTETVSNKSTKQEPMKKIYHMLFDAFFYNDCSESTNWFANQSVWTQIAMIETDIQRKCIGRNEAKKKNTETKDIQKIQKYYFAEEIDKDDLGTPHNQMLTQDGRIISFEQTNNNLQSTDAMLKTIGTSIFNQSKHNLIIKPSYTEKNLMTRKDKEMVKIQSPKNVNFQQYYFKAQINKDQKHGTGSKEVYETKNKKQKIKNEYKSIKNIKSLSPKVNLTSNSPFPNDSLLSPKKIGIEIKRCPSIIFAIPDETKIKSMNQLPIDVISSVENTPKNVHGIFPLNSSRTIFQNRSNSKIKIFSQSPRSLSPQQHTQMMTEHWFPSQNSHIKESFRVNRTPQKVTSINRPPSNHTFHQVKPLYYTPTNSNVSNRSGFDKNSPKVINYGPSVGFNYQTTNRRSPIMSTHSNQSNEKIFVSKSSHTLLSPTQKQMHMMMIPTEIMVENKIQSRRTIIYQEGQNMKSYSPQAHNQHMMPEKKLRKGLNVIGNRDQMSGFQNQSQNQSRIKLNKCFREKCTSNQKIFQTINK